MKKTMKIYMAAALLAVVSPAILAQAPVKVVCNELKQKGNELVIDAVITVDGSRRAPCRRQSDQISREPLPDTGFGIGFTEGRVTFHPAERTDQPESV